MGLVATTVALVLGLLISSAKNFFDAQSRGLKEMAARILLLDRILARYGPETKDIRDLLRRDVVDGINKVWPKENQSSPFLAAPPAEAEALLVEIQALLPKDDTQRLLQIQASNITLEHLKARWLMYEEGAESVSVPMLAIVVFWLSTIFLSFGLFAPGRVTVITALFLAALSVSAAIFLIVEMYAPFGGLIKIPSASLRAGLRNLGQ